MGEIARIEAEHLKRTIFGDQFRFVARTSSGMTIGTSQPFECSNGEVKKTGRPSNGPKEKASLESLVNELIRGGWRVTNHTVSPWYSVELANASDDEVIALQREAFLRANPLSIPPAEPTGLSTQTMWAISLIVIIALFCVCVFLVFSAEFQFTAG